MLFIQIRRFIRIQIEGQVLCLTQAKLVTKFFAFDLRHTTNSSIKPKIQSIILNIMSASNKTILVIDDEEQFRDYMTALLEKNNFTVCVAENGLIGEQQVSICMPDLIITDIVMPDKEGVEFIQSIRKTDSVTPVIAVSGGSRVNAYSYLSMSKKLGANAILAKPFSNAEILKTINDLLYPSPQSASQPLP